MVLHLGGVAELVFLPQVPAAADVVAFDAGPCTTLIDMFMWKFNHRHFDADGAVAAGGRFNPALLNELQIHRWYQQSEPKRADLGEFGETWMWRVLQMAEKHDCRGPDLIATITELTAWNLARDVLTLTQRPHEIILTGGGAMNIHLAGRLRQLLAPSKTVTCEKYGYGLRAERAVAQAALAAARLDGAAANCSTTSGAWEPTCLGLLACP